MTLAIDLKKLGKHLAVSLEDNKALLLLEDGVTRAFEKAVYGEPKVINAWPLASVQPFEKVRNLREGATRKFNISFRYYVVIYHGKVADTLEIQEGAHERAERVERFLHTDFHWNFVDKDDHDRDQVIFGYVTLVDHPVVIAPEQELWSASRLELTAISQEVF